MSPSYTHDDYTVGWITALPVESASAHAMLDEEHEDLDGVPSDTNTYTLGRIGKHNIVVAGLPQGIIGTTAASGAALNLLRSFPNIKFGLMVGIGGGVPGGKQDVRLGDVVVSTPQNQVGGVIQYDFGTNIQASEFVRKGVLSNPPIAVRTAVAKLTASAMRKGYKFHGYYEQMLEDNVEMRSKFQRPSTDVLYEANYIHAAGSEQDCGWCDPARIVKRVPREETVVHFGLIGSGNQVIRNALLRDEISQKENILCFEMEAAGLMNDFPCLVIRGICDYCDTHKNKDWQPYAAAIAATYAKELLMTVPSQQVQTLPPTGARQGGAMYNITYNGNTNHGLQIGHSTGDIYYGGQ